MWQADFHSGERVRAVEQMTARDIDRLPFGVIKLDPAGSVELFNLAERVQSGYKSRPAMGLHFFTDIAPCMNVPAVKGRIDAAMGAGEVDVEVGWTGDFSDPDRAMVIRCQSASDGGLWVFLRREED
jgi:photoactive yellow protein